MVVDTALHIFIGWDDREAVTADVLAHSITKRTDAKLNIQYLRHRELRQDGLFVRPWEIESTTGDYIDKIDNKKFSTQFSHTRFLVPKLMNYEGWALFADSDMVCMTDIAKVFAMADNKYAVMCVKHNHIPPINSVKMDGREQLRYQRKNWSSFVLWNCSHPANAFLTQYMVSFMRGSELHAFKWLSDDLIGSLPYTYNYISGVSPRMNGGMPDVIHYTDGGPWFDGCKDVPYAGTWTAEYEDWQVNGKHVSNVPSASFDKEEVIRK